MNSRKYPSSSTHNRIGFCLHEILCTNLTFKLSSKHPVRRNDSGEEETKTERHRCARYDYLLPIRGTRRDIGNRDKKPCILLAGSALAPANPAQFSCLWRHMHTPTATSSMATNIESTVEDCYEPQTYTMHKLFNSRQL